jgi:hypothetical protein
MKFDQGGARRPRHALVLAVVLSAVALGAMPARASDDPTTWTNGTFATSSSAGLSGIRDMEVHIDVQPGFFSFENCSIPAGVSCVEPDYRIHASESVCVSTVTYTTRAPVVGECSIGSSGSESEAGTASVDISDPNGCNGFSYQPTRNTASDIVYRDAAGNNWTVTQITWSASGHVVLQGSQWTVNTVHLVAKTRLEGTQTTYTLNLSLTGSLSATGNCSLMSQNSFGFKVAGSSAQIQIN